MKIHTKILMIVSCFIVAVSCNKEIVQKSSSMEPNIKNGEAIMVDFRAYAHLPPSRWDVIVFKSKSGSENYCSRVVGFPDEIITINNGGIVINGDVITKPSNLASISYSLPVKNPWISTIDFPYRIPNGEYFILGDNTSNSLDGRYWGGVRIENIIGKIQGR